MTFIKSVITATLMTLVAFSVQAGNKVPAGVENKGKPVGIACQQAGISTLQSLGLLGAVAKGGIEVVGVGVLDYQTVLELHRTSPELFGFGDTVPVSVVVPDVGPVPAGWCNF